MIDKIKELEKTLQSDMNFLKVIRTQAKDSTPQAIVEKLQELRQGLEITLDFLKDILKDA